MADINTMTGWLLSIMVSMTPADKVDSSESPAVRAERLESIARDIVTVVYDPNEKPAFPGPDGRELSAVFVATTAAYESGYFSAKVDKGLSRGDGGGSWCMMQINVRNGKTSEGWTGKDLVKDRKKCVTVGYRIMKSSMKMCSSSPRSSLAAYISGRCDWAVKEARVRYDSAMRNYRNNPLDAYLRSLKADESAEQT